MFIQIEVESLAQLQCAADAGAVMVLLDNFNLDQLTAAVALCAAQRSQTGRMIVLEASGNIGLENVRSVANTGVNRISIGSLTKNVQAVDLSMRFV